MNTMHITYPHRIENGHGETLIFKGIDRRPDGDWLQVENFVSPGSGPPMHIHWQQDECLTVVKGRMGYQIAGQAEQFAGEGETLLFRRGVAHRFWNAGEETLHCKGWINPPHSIVFFLSSIYAAQHKSGTTRPEAFDAAYLLTRYASEYDMVDIPAFVRKVIMPVTYQVGRLLGKYRHFDGAPKPLQRIARPEGSTNIDQPQQSPVLS